VDNVVIAPQECFNYMRLGTHKNRDHGYYKKLLINWIGVF